MRTICVVVGDKLAQNHAQVRLVQDDEVVEALAPQRPNHPLRHSVRAWGPDRRQQCLGSERLSPPGERRPISAVAISDEVLRLDIPGRRLDELLPDPSRGRMRRNVDVDELTPVVGKSGSRATSLPPRPLRTDRASFPAVSSSLRQRPGRDAAAQRSSLRHGVACGRWGAAGVGSVPCPGRRASARSDGGCASR